MRIEAVEELADATPEVVDGSLAGLSEEGLEFGEGQFDRIEVGLRSGLTMRRDIAVFTNCQCAGAKLPGVPRSERPRRSR